MKLTIVLLMFVFLHAGAVEIHSQGARVTIDANQATLSEVLDEMERQTEYLFFYNKKNVNAGKRVNVNVKDTPVSEVLDETLDGDVAYTMVNDHIILSKKEEKGIASILQQTKRVTGTVTDSSGEAVIGANIVEKGAAANGTVTDADGRFSLNVAEGAVLQVSYIGYVTQEIKIGQQTTLHITLAEDTRLLEEVVVLGYGAATRKADLSAAIGIVENMESLKLRPVSGVTEMLQGQIPGVTVRNNGGDPTSGASITIRGQGSKAGESPLWVVDGVPGGPYNVNDVESVVVLKDAASAAIYGAYSGSAGVILVTTKKAKEGKPSVSYEGTYGFTQATNLPQSLTIEEERRVREASLAAIGAALPTGWDVSKNPYIGQTRTDWIDAIFRTALFQRHNVSISTGTEHFKNRLSLQVNDKQGTLISTFSKSFGLNYDASYNISKHVRVRENFHWSTGSNRGTNTDSGYDGAIILALMMPRNAEVRYADGTYGGSAPKDPEYAAQYGSNFADIHGDVINPVRVLEAENQYKRPSNITSSTFFEIIDPIPGLKFTSRFTYRLNYNFEKTFEPRRTEPGKPSLNNILSYKASRGYSWETENTLNYDRSFGDHALGALVSTTANEQRGRIFSVSAQGFENEDAIYQYLNYADLIRSPSDDYNDPDNNVAVVGRLSYSYANRYFATASWRRDYAGRLPEDKKFGDFPAVTAGWKISEEAFFPKNSTLTHLKARGSWGRIGNLGSIGYAYGNPTLNITAADHVGEQVGINTPPVSGINNGTAFNPFLTWETSEQTDFGLDTEWLDGRLSLSADYFRKRTYNLIKDQDTGWPSYIGLAAKKINEGEIRNTGFEFSLGWNDRIGKATSYFVNANLATLTNKVHDIGPADPNTGEKPVWIEGDSFRGMLYPYRTREGDPLYSYWLVETDGLFQSDAEAEAYKDKDGNRIQPNAKAGDLKFIDQNGDGKINDDDRVYMGAYYPDLTYALTAGFSHRNLSFSVMFQGVAGAKVFQAWNLTMLNESQLNFNRWNRILDAYPNTNDVPRLSASDLNNNFTTNSDWYLEDASYLRVKNIQFAYTLDDLLHRASLLRDRRSSLQTYVSIDNLYTFTKYTGMDPEVGGKGMDQGRYPVPRTISLGIKLTY
ncbi:MAG: TonB-dependent receptor [Tannerella sp.]|nr:TonB-dependent receptor [Tannerella sp.]